MDWTTGIYRVKKSEKRFVNPTILRRADSSVLKSQRDVHREDQDSSRVQDAMKFTKEAICLGNVLQYAHAINAPYRRILHRKGTIRVLQKGDMPPDAECPGSTSNAPRKAAVGVHADYIFVESLRDKEGKRRHSAAEVQDRRSVAVRTI
jgi:hypothetical protein